MMDERDTDRLLGELFKRNAPYVNELALGRRIEERLPRRRKRSRRARSMRVVAIGFASVVLLGGAAFGAYRLVDYLQDQRALVITDLTLQPGDTGPSGAGGTGGSSAIAGLVPVVGTADLEQVKTEGSIEPADDAKYAHWVRGRSYVFSLNMSQPGTSGILEMTSDLQVRNDGSADISSSWVIRSDQGTWECDDWVGYLKADGSEEFGFGEAVGTAGYEGLTLYLQWRSTREPGSVLGAAESVLVSGWIQQAE